MKSDLKIELIESDNVNKQVTSCSNSETRQRLFKEGTVSLLITEPRLPTKDILSQQNSDSDVKAENEPIKPRHMYK